MAGFEQIYAWLDPVLMLGFGLISPPWAGFLFGLFLSALVVTLVGELTFGAVYLFNRRHYADISREMTAHHNLAVRALAVKDKTSYVACNRLANEAFGKNFFSHIALFASSLWPVPFMLGWLDYRFGPVALNLPVAGEVGPAFAFIPLYICVRIGFSRVRGRVPVFRQIKEMIDETEHPEKVLHYTDIPHLAQNR